MTALWFAVLLLGVGQIALATGLFIAGRRAREAKRAAELAEKRGETLFRLAALDRGMMRTFMAVQRSVNGSQIVINESVLKRLRESAKSGGIGDVDFRQL